MNGNQAIYEEQARDAMLDHIQNMQRLLTVLGEDMSEEIEQLNRLRDKVDR